MLYFDKKFEKNSGAVLQKAQFNHMIDMREAFNANQSNPILAANGAAIIPQDVYREFDNQTVQLMRANNLTLLNDLMPTPSLGVAAPSSLSRKQSWSKNIFFAMRS